MVTTWIPFKSTKKWLSFQVLVIFKPIIKKTINFQEICFVKIINFHEIQSIEIVAHYKHFKLKLKEKNCLQICMWPWIQARMDTYKTNE
jgi:hypothetical protein